ncbi:MAG: NAD-dependent epimerase/dehydratase family protein [Thermoguttaceae bacterium]|nr:NAD-dependent epimerase/dehydratase family protein [Thermoguttaceae bacterium]
MARVLVTGASGFLGFHLVRALIERGDEVTCLVRPESRLERIAAYPICTAVGDVADAASVARAAAGQAIVYHLAGRTFARHRRELFAVNEQGVRTVCEVCAGQATPPVVVLVSSLAAAGPSGDRPRTECDPVRPVSDYGRSKRAGELAAAESAGQLPITIVRLPIVFGEADRAMLQVFRPIGRYGVHLVPGFTPQRFAILHASDAVRFLIAAAERGRRLRASAGETGAEGLYFAAGPEQPTYSELGNLIGRALGRRRVVSVPVAHFAVRAAASLAGVTGRLRGRSAYLNPDKAREATAGSWTCSPQKAERELGVCVSTPLADHLGRTAAWYREQGWV